MSSDHLLKSLQAAFAKPNTDGFTVVELCEQAGMSLTGHSKEKIREFLKAEIAAKRVIGKIGRRTAISGMPAAVPIFFPVEKKK